MLLSLSLCERVRLCLCTQSPPQSGRALIVIQCHSSCSAPGFSFSWGTHVCFPVVHGPLRRAPSTVTVLEFLSLLRTTAFCLCIARQAIGKTREFVILDFTAVHPFCLTSLASCYIAHADRTVQCSLLCASINTLTRLICTTANAVCIALLLIQISRTGAFFGSRRAVLSLFAFFRSHCRRC